VSTAEDDETGEVRETHRRPNLQPFLDDPDCWLVASIEDYDLESDTARPGPIFTERVIAPPAPPVITSAADALAVVLNERGHVDPDHIAELVHRDADDVIAELGGTIFRDPADGSWQTADAYLSGAVRSKLAAAEAAAALDPEYERNVAALREVQPADLRPSDITARLGAPWIPRCRYHRFRPRDDGRGDQDPPHAGTGVVDRGSPPARLDGRRHIRMGHRAAARRPASVRCAQFLGAADLRHHQGRR
jgi:N12 class adenine-specific DNA methylase